MIQRIQTLLLLVAAICFVITCFMPVGYITTDDIYYVITPWVLKENIPDGMIIYRTYFIGMLQTLLAIISFVAIFFYRKRALQSKICIAAIILNFILIIIMLWVYPDNILPKLHQISGSETDFSLFALLSVVPLICLYFANRYIIKDEKKVRAADRLR
jgi:hypothetical protein